MRALTRLFRAQACVIATFVIASSTCHAQTLNVTAKDGPTKILSSQMAHYGDLPLAFEPNRGQADPDARFLSRSTGQVLLLEPNQAVLLLNEGRDTASREHLVDAQPAELRIRFKRANELAEITPLDAQPGKTNYILGNDPAKWRTNIDNYSQVLYKSLYPGVDLVFYGNQRRLEHDFIVAPGADYRSIALDITGGRKIRMRPDGGLTLELPSAAGEVNFSAPEMYQIRDGKRISVRGGYKLKKNLLAFNVGPHDKNLPLIIDPVLSYSTYLAGSMLDAAAGIALDSAGNAYITGFTFSTDFPTKNPYQPMCDNCAAAPDIFITKLNPTGTALVYSTYLGGSSYDQPFSIAVDAAGDAVVGGVTSSSDFPAKNPIQPFSSQQEAFITSLSPDGSALNFSTALGGSSGSNLATLTTDANGNIYAAGQTASSDFPVTPATNVIGVPPGNGLLDIFVAKITPAGALVFGTTIGPDPQQQQFNTIFYPANGEGIAVDSSENVYLAGGASQGFLVTPGAFQTTYTGPAPNCGGCTMGFIAKLKPDGSAFIYASYLGGSGGDQVTGMVLDSSEDMFVTGNTSSPNFPITAGAFQTTFPAGQSYSPCCESFVTKVNPTGTALLYSTFLGGPTTEGAGANTAGIAIDASGDAYVTGYTWSPTFPLLDPLVTTLPHSIYGGPLNPAAFVTKFNATGSSILFSTFFSGSTGTTAAGIALNPAAPNAVFIAGNTYDTDLPTTPGAFQTTVVVPPPYEAADHVFVTQFNLAVAASAICPNQTSLLLVASVNKNSPPATFTLTNCGNGPLNVSQIVVTGPFKQTSNCKTAVQPGNTCAINVVFRETTSGTFPGTLTISSNAPIQPLTLQLSGQAIAPIVEIYSNPLQLDDQLVGQTGLPTQLIIFNQGDDVLQISSVTLVGSDFSENKKNCDTPVEPGNACFIEITFHPLAAGPRTGTLTLTDNALNSPQTVTLQGNGLTAYPVPTVSSITPNSIQQNSASQTINVQGGGFFETSRISVQGTLLKTTYDGENSLSAQIPASMLKNLGQLTVEVTTPAPGGGISNSTSLLIYQDLAIGANDLIFEPYTRQLYLSIASTASANPNTIVSLDPQTQTFGTPVAIGSGPDHFGLSSDGELLYVGLDGSSAIQQYNTRTGKLGSSVSLASIATGQPVNAFDIRAVPGRSQDYVVSLRLPFTSPSEAGVALVSNGKLESTLPNAYPLYVSADSLCFLSDPKTFYGSDGSQLLEMIIQNHTTLGVNVDLTVPQGLGSAFAWDSKYIYDYTGLVFDPVSNQTLGTYPLPQGGFGSSVLPDSSVGRTYFLAYGQPGFEVFDQSTFALVGSIALPQTVNTPLKLVRWGTDGFAFLSYNFTTSSSDVILIQSSLARPSVGPNPVPAVASASPEVNAKHGNFQLTVTGSNFVPGAAVRWNGSDRTTILESSTVLIADIPASDVSAAGSAEITVFNPPQGGGTSKQLKYVISAAK